MFGNSLIEDTQKQMIKSPYNQEFPDCTKGNNAKPMITKSKLKVMACPMIKDEEGFLSEWAAYYKAHGFSHVMFLDDGSTDNFMEELQPWIKTGFVSVKSNTTITDMRGTKMKTPFMKNMAKKAILEGMCIKQAIKWDYDYFVSLDLDEYVVPDNQQHGLTFVDALDSWEKKSGRKMFCMMKYNFASTPHIAEPVHLLTIEAYQTRMTQPGKMNYYTSVAKKCLYKLKDPKYRPETQEFIGECCHFHGCQGDDFRVKSNICQSAWKNATAQIYSQDIGGKFAPLGSIFHYSRSLEKFALKKKTWTTAGGESTARANDYSISYFLHRSVGYTLDTTMNAYSCETRRKWLEVHTDSDRYLRFGNSWYRNIEFNKKVSDPEKRGRYGHEKKGQVRDGNPYLYDGSVPPLMKRNSKISKVGGGGGGGKNGKNINNGFTGSGNNGGGNDNINTHKGAKKKKGKNKKKVLDIQPKEKENEINKVQQEQASQPTQQQESTAIASTPTTSDTHNNNNNNNKNNNNNNNNNNNDNIGGTSSKRRGISSSVGDIDSNNNNNNMNSGMQSSGKRRREPGVVKAKQGAKVVPKGPLTTLIAKAMERSERRERKKQELEDKKNGIRSNKRSKLGGKERNELEEEEMRRFNEILAKKQAEIDAKTREVQDRKKKEKEMTTATTTTTAAA